VVWADVEPIFTENCIGCHDSSRTGVERADAPEEYNYDSPQAAAASPNWTWAEVTLGHMPPSGPLDEADQQLIREWLACGGPE
jgi:mono/diheme cytochrome c family protein